MKTVAEFKIHYRQILGPRGEVVAPLPQFAADTALVLRMYRAMTLVRVFDAKAVNLQRTGQLGTYPSSLGHEAAHVGVGAAMRPEDVLAPVYREFGTQLWRGVTMTEILTYWGGDERGSDFAVPRQDFAWCVPIATQTLHAAGAAMAFKVLKQPRCARLHRRWRDIRGRVLRSAQSSWGARFARGIRHRQQRLGHFCARRGANGRANLGAEGGGRGYSGRAGRRQRCVRRPGGGRGGARGRATRRGPEFDRGADVPTERSHDRYRSGQEVKDAWALEPLLRIRDFLINAGLWDGAKEQALLDECTLKVDAAVTEYLGKAKPSSDAMFEHLFAALPARLHEQRLIARKYGSKPSGH